MIEITITVLVWKQSLLSNEQFHWPYLAFSILLISTSSVWARPVTLAWIDSPVTYTYRITATGESGAQYVLTPATLGPYDYQFTLGAFPYLSPEPCFSVAWGATDLATFAKIRNAESIEQLVAIETQYGTNHFQQKNADAMSRFLARFLRNKNENGSLVQIPRWLCAPRMLWTFPRGTVYVGQEKLIDAEITQVFSGFVQGSYQVIRERRVLHVDLVDDDSLD